ncbi:hypothetical protein RvY_01131-2 [Ramazzottius varieornatus]|uniref:Protein LLP homolog n=1 Tax=Ramazzottius varieornatus TaxID=947166 RepID=A0A1D1UQJ1_RAMVA|nr:hypothetical protein RvY_01131-2 [Ramazzottius varieornatus]
MAKSMRSKFKRKMRALKREKYYNREVEKLKKTTARIQLSSDPDIIIKKEAEETSVFGAQTDVPAENLPTAEPDDSVMEIGELKPRNKLKFQLNPKTLRNEHGNYPVWVNQRKIKQIKRKGKTQKRTQIKGRGIKKKTTSKSKSK